MTVSFTATVTGLDSVLRSMRDLRGGLRDFRPLWEKLEADFYRIQNAHFDSQGARAGERWQPNSPVYAAIKAKEYGERRVMHLEGGLRESFTRRGAAGQVRKVSDRELVLGSSLLRAQVHHYGSSSEMWIPSPFFLRIRGVPARNLIGVTAEDEKRWAQIGEKHLLGLFNGGAA
jgi:hypothetical protein